MAREVVDVLSLTSTEHDLEHHRSFKRNLGLTAFRHTCKYFMDLSDEFMWREPVNLQDLFDAGIPVEPVRVYGKVSMTFRSPGASSDTN